MISIEAPGRTITLPNYQVSNHERLLSTTSLQKSRNGKIYTYNRRRIERNYQWSFGLTFSKALELKEFLDLHNSSILIVTDIDGTRLQGTLVSNPVEFNHEARDANCIEYVTTTIEFELVKLADKPFNLFAVLDNDDVTLTWNGNSPEYVLEVSNNKLIWTTLTTTTNTTYIHENINPNTPYYYRVRGLKNSVLTQPSNIVSVLYIIPMQFVTQDDDEILLNVSW